MDEEEIKRETDALCETHKGTLEALASDGRDEAEEGVTFHHIDVLWDPERFTIQDLYDILHIPEVELCQIWHNSEWYLDKFKDLYADDKLYGDLEDFVRAVNEKRGEGTAHIEVKEVFTEEEDGGGDAE